LAACSFLWSRMQS